MRQDFFQYTPQFKLVIAGNHKPGLRSVDEAMRRRLHLVPFAVTIPPAERDPDLSEKLKVEWPGILAWIIKGALEWEDKGLEPPELVTRATATYLDQQDNLGEWLRAECQIGPEYKDNAMSLFRSWTKWMQASGMEEGKRTSFTDNLRAKGFVDQHTRIGTTFGGLRVTPRMTECE